VSKSLPASLPASAHNMAGGGGSDDGTSKPLWLQVLALSAFVTFNIGLNEFNSWALKEGQWPNFHFTWFYTMFHMLVSAFAAYLLQCLVVKPKLGPPTFAQFWEYKLVVIPMGLCTFLMNGLNNASLSLVSLFLNQAIKATMPAPTMLFSFLLAKKTYTPIKIAVVLLLCVGSVFSVWYKISSDSSGSQISGVVMVFTGLLAASIKPVIVMMLMDGLVGDSLPKLEPTVVLVYDCCIAFVCMLTTWACMDERQASIEYLADSSTTGIGILIIAIGSAMAFCFNLSNFYFIKLTSALTATVGGSGVKILLIVVSAVQAGVDDLISWCGVSLVVITLVSYSYLNLPKPKPPPEADAEKGAAAPKPGEATPLVKP